MLVMPVNIQTVIITHTHRSEPQAKSLWTKLLLPNKYCILLLTNLDSDFHFLALVSKMHWRPQLLCRIESQWKVVSCVSCLSCVYCFFFKLLMKIKTVDFPFGRHSHFGLLRSENTFFQCQTYLLSAKKLFVRVILSKIFSIKCLCYDKMFKSLTFPYLLWQNS